jgi:hypothetical protein
MPDKFPLGLQAHMRLLAFLLLAASMVPGWITLSTIAPS